MYDALNRSTLAFVAALTQDYAGDPRKRDRHEGSIGRKVKLIHQRRSVVCPELFIGQEFCQNDFGVN